MPLGIMDVGYRTFDYDADLKEDPSCWRPLRENHETAQIMLLRIDLVCLLLC